MINFILRATKSDDSLKAYFKELLSFPVLPRIGEHLCVFVDKYKVCDVEYHRVNSGKVIITVSVDIPTDEEWLWVLEKSDDWSIDEPEWK